MTRPPDPRTTIRLPFEPRERCPDCGEAVDGPPGMACPEPACALARAVRARRAVGEERRARAEAALRRRGLDPERSSWSMTPFNPAALVPVDETVREDFLTRLRDTVDAAVRSPPGEVSQPSAPGSGAAEVAAHASLAAACAGCRGWCCRRGGTEAAFLTPETVRRVRGERPGLSPSAIVDLYASHIGVRHSEGGCVFHDERGCRLPRALRSDTCNDWFCDDLDAVRRRWVGKDGPPLRHAFVAISSGRDPVRDVREVEP